MRERCALSDSELIVRYLDKGSEEAFTMLVERYQAMVIGCAFRRTRNMELARDVAQEVFATLARKMHTLSDRASLGGWLHKAAVFESARMVLGEERRQTRQARFVAEASTSFDSMQGIAYRVEQVAVLDEVLGTLSDADREVLVLHYFQDLSYSELAQQFGANEPAIRQRVCRALERFSKQLKKRRIVGGAAGLLAHAAEVQASLAIPSGLSCAALTVAAVESSFFVTWGLGTLLSYSGAKGAAGMIVSATGILVLWQVAVEIPKKGQESAEPKTEENRGAVYRESARAVAFVPDEQGNALNRLPTNVASHDMRTDAGKLTGSTFVKAPKIAQLAMIPLSRPRVPLAMQAAPVASSKSAISRNFEKFSKKEIDLRSDLHRRLREQAERSGLPAVVDELRHVELVPNEAAEIYGLLLAKVLALQPQEQLRVEEVLQGHYERLKVDGLAGEKPREITAEAWKFARGEVIDFTAKTIEQVVSGEASPTVAGIIHDVLHAPEKLVEHIEIGVRPDSVSAAVEQMPHTGNAVISAIENLLEPERGKPLGIIPLAR